MVMLVYLLLLCDLKKDRVAIDLALKMIYKTESWPINMIEGIVGIFVLKNYAVFIDICLLFSFPDCKANFFYNIYCLAQRYVFLMIPEESLISCYI